MKTCRTCNELKPAKKPINTWRSPMPLQSSQKILVRRSGRLSSARLVKLGPLGITVRLAGAPPTKMPEAWKGPKNTSGSPMPNSTLLQTLHESERRWKEVFSL